LYLITMPPPPRPTLFPYTTLFRSLQAHAALRAHEPLQLHLVVAVKRQEQAALLPVAAAEAAVDLDVPHPFGVEAAALQRQLHERDRKSTRLNSSHVKISYAVFCLK